MQQILTYTLLLSVVLFCGGDRGSAHPVDIHLPTSYDYLHETEYERDRANKEAQKTLDKDDSSEEEIQRALDQLYGPNGTRA